MSILNFLAALLIIYIVWTVTVKKGMKNLTCSRSFDRETAFAGETGELVEVVRNDGPFVIPWLRVESYISAGLRLGKADNLLVSGDTFYRSCFTLMPYQQIRRRHQVAFLHRGVYDLGNASLSSGDLLGLARFWKDQQLHTPITVYPRILDDEELPYPVSRFLGDLIRKNQLHRDPFFVRGVRDYQPGDLIRDIHWPATARSGELQVRVHDSTARTRLMVVLNVQHHDNQWDDYIVQEDARPIEEGICLAASLCVHALRAGLSAGFGANMPVGQGKESTLRLPGEGSAYAEELLSTFAGLNIRCAEKFLPFLESLQVHTDMDILVISRYDSDGIQAAIEKLRDSGNQVTFYQLEGGGV